MLLDNVNEVLNYYCPLKKVSYSQKKSKSKLWINQDKLKSTAVKNRLHRKMCRTKDTTRKTELEKKVKHYKNNLVKLTRSGKANRYNNFLNESKLNLLKTWNRIHKIINIRPKKTNYVTSLQFNNTIISDSKLIANLFNNLFTSIAKNRTKINIFEIQIFWLLEKSLSADLLLNTYKWTRCPKNY